MPSPLLEASYIRPNPFEARSRSLSGGLDIFGTDILIAKRCGYSLRYLAYQNGASRWNPCWSADLPAVGKP